MASAFLTLHRSAAGTVAHCLSSQHLILPHTCPCSAPGLAQAEWHVVAPCVVVGRMGSWWLPSLCQPTLTPRRRGAGKGTGSGQQAGRGCGVPCPAGAAMECGGGSRGRWPSVLPAPACSPAAAAVLFLPVPAVGPAAGATLSTAACPARAGAGSGCLWVLTTSLLPQDYTDALMTNYCVSSGSSRRQVRPTPWCCAGCVRGRVAAPGSSAPLSTTLGAAAGSAGRPELLGRGGHGMKVLAGPLHHRLLLCPDLATGANRKLLLRAAEAQVVPRPWPRLLGCWSPWLWTCALCPQAGCRPVRCHRVELLPLLESKSDVREKPRPLPVPPAA